MKKILYIFDVPTNLNGGAQESMKLIINELKSEFEFYCITPKQDRVFKNQLIFKQSDNFYNLSRFYEKILLIYNVYLYILKIKPDIIHIQMPMGVHIVNTLIKLKLLNKEIKIVYTDRHIYNKYDLNMYKEIKYLIKYVEEIVVTTEYNKKLYNREGINNVRVISNTCGKSFETYDENLIKQNKEKYKIKKNELVIGFCGRYCADKNWPLALKIINLLSNKYENIKFVVCIATDKSLENIQKAESFIHGLQNNMNSEKLIILKDVNFKKINEIYYLLDCFIVTSTTESFGRTAIEAMSRKNIVFSTKVDGVQEVVKIDETLYHDQDEFYSKFNKIFKSAHEVKKYKTKFYNRFKDEFNLEKNINEHRKLYNEF